MKTVYCITHRQFVNADSLYDVAEHARSACTWDEPVCALGDPLEGLQTTHPSLPIPESEVC